MSSPIIAGAVALLLQGKPSATAQEIKDAIKSTALKDVLTGSATNTIWGAGKLDVFKAMGVITSADDATKITYAYDEPTSADKETAAIITSRKAVRFTPTASGKLGGVYFTPHNFVAKTSLEIRKNNIIPVKLFKIY